MEFQIAVFLSVRGGDDPAAFAPLAVGGMAHDAGSPIAQILRRTPFCGRSQRKFCHNRCNFGFLTLRV